MNILLKIEKKNKDRKIDTYVIKCPFVQKIFKFYTKPNRFILRKKCFSLL